MNGHLTRRAAFASISVAVFLVLLKFFAYLATDSISLLASLADSALDVIASGINLIAIHSALTPADREHRFGHGKAEPLAGLAQFAFIGGSAIFLVLEASQRFAVPQPVEHGAAGVAVMLVSIVLTGALVSYQRYVKKKTNSLAVHADSAHYAGDLLTISANCKKARWKKCLPNYGASNWGLGARNARKNLSETCLSRRRKLI